MTKFKTINAQFTIPVEKEKEYQKMIFDNGGELFSWSIGRRPWGQAKKINGEPAPTPIRDYVENFIKSNGKSSKDQIAVDLFQNSGLPGVKLNSANLVLQQLVNLKKISKDDDGLYSAIE